MYFGLRVYDMSGTQTKRQLLPEGRYAGVRVSIDPDGNWHVSPVIRDEPTVLLCVRRVDHMTAVITDLDGAPYSKLMRVEDAIRLLRELT